eukprot:15483128-Heterocapsa_arctica.AAC.1
MGVTRELDDWQSFVYDGIKRARQQAWAKRARNKHNYKGIDGEVGEATTRNYYFKFAQTEPMKPGALHTISRWSVDPTKSVQQTEEFKREIPELGYLNLRKKRAQENKPECFWDAGIIATYWTTLPLTEQSEDTCHPCKGTATTVYIDGSSYKLGASNYSGWRIWSNKHGPLKGNKQSSDRAE